MVPSRSWHSPLPMPCPERGRFLGIDRGGWLLFAAQGLSGLGNGPFIAFSAIYQRQLGASPLEIGLIAAFGMVVGTLAMIPGTRLAEQADLRRTIVMGWLLAVPAPLFFLVAPHWSLTVVGVAFLSGSFVNTPAINVYMTLGVQKERVALVMTTVLSAFSLGLILSNLLTGWLAQTVGLRWLFLLPFGFFCLAGLCIGFLPSKLQPLDGTAVPSYPDLFRDRAFVALLFLFALLTLIIFLPWPFTPLYAQEVARSDNLQVGSLMGVLYLGSVFMGMTLGGLRRALGCMWIVVCFEAAYIVSAVLLLSSAFFPVLILAFFLRGAFWSFRQVMTAVIGEVLPYAALSKGYGLFGVVTVAAATVAYPIGGWMYTQDPAAPFWVSALCMMVAVVATVLLRGAFSAGSEASRAQWEELPRAA